MVTSGLVSGAAGSNVGPASSTPQITTTQGPGAGYMLTDNQTGAITAAFDSYNVPSITCLTSPNATTPISAPVTRPLASQMADMGVGLWDDLLNTSEFGANQSLTAIYQLGIKPVCPDYFQNGLDVAEYGYANITASTTADPFGFDLQWVAIPGFVLHPGDSIRSAMSWASNSLTFDLRDVTDHQAFTKTVAAVPGFAPDAAFCLIDQFSNIAKIGDVTNHCRVTVNGTTGGIGTFPAPSVIYRTLEMGLDGTTVAVRPTTLASDGATYTDRWVTSMPYEIEHPGLLYQRQAPGFAGYLLFNHRSGSVSAVTDSYEQPTATCNVHERLGGPSGGFFPGDQNFLVGSGLFSGSRNLSNYTYFEAGTEAYCPEFNVNPVYLPFYLEGVVTPTHPRGAFTMVRLPGLAVHPGDLIRSSVAVGSWPMVRFVLTDLSDGASSSTTIRAPGFDPNGAGCVSQPFGNLAVFSTTSQTCRVTMGGHARGIGDFGGPNVLDRFGLVSNAGTLQGATSPLTSDGSTFSVRWITSQPVFYEA